MNFLALLLLGLAAEKDDGGYILTKPERSLEDIDKIYASMPPVKYSPPADRWQHIERTKKALEEGGKLRIVMLGDSIVNDTSRSGWTLLLGRRYPRVTIETVTSVRGSTGCWWYKEDGRLKKYVLDQKPDLLIIGGISQRDDIDSIRTVIEKVRAGSKAEILLMTGAFGDVDPRDDKKWSFAIDPAGKDYRARLKRLAEEVKTAFIDMHDLWGKYVRNSGKDLGWFKRDPIHANEKGEQILGRLLEQHFAPDETKSGPGAQPKPEAESRPKPEARNEQ